MNEARTIAAPTALPRNVKLLGLASLLNDVASEMVYPLLPRFLTGVLGGTAFDLGLIEGVADSASSLLKLFSGHWSDRAGRRKGFVLFGYGLAALVRPLTAVVRVPWQLLAVRAADRVGKGVRTSPRDALIADSTDASMRGRAFGFHRAMDHLGAAVGPLLASAFLFAWPEEFRALFLTTIVPGLAVVALLAIGLRETGGPAGPRQNFRLTLAPFDRRFRVYLVALVVFTLGNASDAFLLLRAGELGVATAALPLLWCAFHIAKSAGNWLVGNAVDRFGARRFIAAGWIVYAGVYAAFAWATTAWQAWAFFLAYAGFYALTEPSEKALVAQLAGGERKGLAFGWYNFAVGVVTLPASLLFGALYSWLGAPVAFGTGATLALAATGLLAFGGPARAAAGRADRAI